jgi:hypothetical protein
MKMEAASPYETSFDLQRTLNFKLYITIILSFLYLGCETIGTVATPDLLCQPRVIVKMIVEKQMECTLAGEAEVLSEKTCPSATFVHHKIPHDKTRV